MFLAMDKVEYCRRNNYHEENIMYNGIYVHSCIMCLGGCGYNSGEFP